MRKYIHIYIYIYIYINTHTHIHIHTCNTPKLPSFAAQIDPLIAQHCRQKLSPQAGSERQLPQTAKGRLAGLGPRQIGLRSAGSDSESLWLLRTATCLAGSESESKTSHRKVRALARCQTSPQTNFDHQAECLQTVTVALMLQLPNRPQRLMPALAVSRLQTRTAPADFELHSRQKEARAADFAPLHLHSRQKSTAVDSRQTPKHRLRKLNSRQKSKTSRHRERRCPSQR